MTAIKFEACQSVEEIDELYKKRYARAFKRDGHFYQLEEWFELSEEARKAYERFPAPLSEYEQELLADTAKSAKTYGQRKCVGCHTTFVAKTPKQLYHSRECWLTRGHDS